MDIYERMKELGIELPEAPPPVGLFLPARQLGNALFASGQGSFYKDHRVEGKGGSDVTLEEAFVSSAPDFYQQPAVVNGASQLLIDLWGEDGRHARSAIATNTLPSNLSVEIEVIFELK